MQKKEKKRLVGRLNEKELIVREGRPLEQSEIEHNFNILKDYNNRRKMFRND